MEQETIRARSIELVNERGDIGIALNGGGGDREPGMPYIMANTAAGSVVLLTFDQNGEPEVHLRDTDGIDRTLDL